MQQEISTIDLFFSVETEFINEYVYIYDMCIIKEYKKFVL